MKVKKYLPVPDFINLHNKGLVFLHVGESKTQRGRLFSYYGRAPSGAHKLCRISDNNIGTYTKDWMLENMYICVDSLIKLIGEKAGQSILRKYGDFMVAQSDIDYCELMTYKQMKKVVGKRPPEVFRVVFGGELDPTEYHTQEHAERAALAYAEDGIKDVLFLKCIGSVDTKEIIQYETSIKYL